jgi:hypothetical protein
MPNQYDIRLSDADIAAQLDETVSNLGLAKRLGTSPVRVDRIRRANGIAPFRRGARPKYASQYDAIKSQTVIDGDHLHWTGPTTGNNKTPVVHWNNTVSTVARAVFEQLHERKAVGRVLPNCGRTHCHQPDHLTDRVMRGGTA